MKINRSFAPVTIVIEYEEELKFFREILDRAREHKSSGGLFFGSVKQDAFIDKCNHIRGQLQ